MKSILLPLPEMLRDMLSTLLGRQVTVKDGPAVEMEGKSATVVGLYVADSGDLVALCLSDLGLAGFTGAALSLVPPAVVEAEIGNGQLSETVLDNFREVLNVLSAALNKPDTPHVVLKGTFVCPSETLPEDAQTLLASPAARADFEASIAGYGDGTFSILSVL